MALSRLNRDSIFIENKDFAVENIINDILDFKEKQKVFFNYNVYNNDNNIIEISLFVGLNSDFANNQILNSNYYYNDEKVKKNFNNVIKEYEPFSETKSTPNDLFTNIPVTDNSSDKGQTDVFMNPLIIPKTYGLLTEEVIILGNLYETSNEPFEEMINLEDINEYFKNPRELVYPRYYNAYSLSRLNSNISIFGTIEEINGNLTTEIPLQGMRVEIINNGTDGRGREIHISNSISIRESEGNLPQSRIEGFSDQIVEDLPIDDSSMIVRNYEYQNILFNGHNIVSFKTGESVSSTGTRLTNNAYYYNEDQLQIIPFDDSRIVEVLEADYDEEQVFSPTGQTTDNINGGSPDSIAFLGEND